ncbi:MAG: SDR family oxidoreductase [Alteromonadaceae bacterium]|nr:SDR family oxidoreductase [Alteromonadaceae bacterium]
MHHSKRKRSRVAIVTGASRGIGAEIALALAADGIAVIVNYATSADKANTIVKHIKQQGGTALAVKADLSKPDMATSLFDEAENTLGKVSILVNNAGVMELSPVADVTDVSFERQVSLNLCGPFRLMREAAKRLADDGRIINLSSSVVGLYQPGYAVYAATKAALEAMTKITAKELGGRGITVNAIAPGPVATELFLKGKSEELLDNIKNMNPFKRLGEPQDIARVVQFLSRSDATWINGQVVRANGGVV